MSKKYVAGISVNSRQCQFGVFEVRDQKRLLLHSEVHERNDESPFWFLNGIDSSSKKFKNISKLSVALDASSVVVHSFLLDTTLTHNEQQEHIHWEFSNIIVSYQPQDYVVDIHALKAHVREQTSEILAVAVPRQQILDMQKLITGNGWKVGIIDTVYFAAEYALLVNYPEIKTKCVALAVINDDRMDIGWYVNGRLTCFTSYPDAAPDLAIQKIQNRQNDFSVSEVFYCGQVNIVEDLRFKHKELGLPMTVVDPFRRLVKKSIWRTHRAKDGGDYMLAACAGIALQSR